MATVQLVVNLCALAGVAAYSAWSLRRHRLRPVPLHHREWWPAWGRPPWGITTAGLHRRPHGLRSLDASPRPNLVTTFTTRRTRQVGASSNSSTAHGLVPVDTATLLRQAAKSRLTGRGSYGIGTAAHGESGVPLQHATCGDVNGNGCELEARHGGAHEATFLLCEASPDWTGSHEQWAAFYANPPRITLSRTPRGW